MAGQIRGQENILKRVVEGEREEVCWVEEKTLEWRGSVFAATEHKVLAR